MKLNKNILILIILIGFFTIICAYSAQHSEDIGCCSIVLQLEDNDTLMSFRRDSDIDADIHIEKVNWYGIPAIKQYKEEGGYFGHVIITHDGWVIGIGGTDDDLGSEKCEKIASKMITDDYSISKDSLAEIQELKKPYGRGHFVIKAPNGNYGFVNVDKLKTGHLKPGQYISIPNNYSLSRSGTLSLDSDDLIKDMNELAQTDKYGVDRRDIITYDVNINGSENLTNIYVSNEDGSKINQSYENCVDDVYIENSLIKSSDIPIAPEYSHIGNLSFTVDDLNPYHSITVNGILIGSVIFIIGLGYGVFRFVRLLKFKF